MKAVKSAEIKNVDGKKTEYEFNLTNESKKAGEKVKNLEVKQEAVEDTLPVNENIISTKIEPETEEVKNDGEIIEGADKPETIGETISVEEVLSVQKELPLKESSTAEEPSQSPGLLIASEIIEETLPMEEEAGLVEVLKDDDQVKSSENSEIKESVEHLSNDPDMSSMGLNDNSTPDTDIITPVYDENLEQQKCEEKKVEADVNIQKNSNKADKKWMAGSDGRKLESELKVKKKDVNSETPPKFGNKGGIPAPSKESSLRLEFSDKLNRRPTGHKEVKILQKDD